MAITPPVKLYKSAETLPAYTAPSPHLIATIKNASIGEYIMSAANEKIFASPILAPGMNIGGNWFSIMKVMRLRVVNTAKVAIFFAVKLLRFKI